MLVTGCLKELLSKLSELSEGKALGDRNTERCGGHSDDPPSLSNHNSGDGQVDADLGDGSSDVVYIRGNRQSCTNRGKLEPVDRGSGVNPVPMSCDVDGSDNDDELGYSFPPRTRTCTAGCQAVVAVIFGAHMLLETSPLASLNGEQVLPSFFFLIFIEWRAARRIELFAHPIVIGSYSCHSVQFIAHTDTIAPAPLLCSTSLYFILLLFSMSF